MDEADSELSSADREQLLTRLGLDSTVARPPLRWGSHEVRSCREETRLKFNALVPVTAMLLALTVVDADGQPHELEAEALFWHRDGEWEVTETRRR